MYRRGIFVFRYVSFFFFFFLENLELFSREYELCWLGEKEKIDEREADSRYSKWNARLRTASFG